MTANTGGEKSGKVGEKTPVAPCRAFPRRLLLRAVRSPVTAAAIQNAPPALVEALGKAVLDIRAAYLLDREGKRATAGPARVQVAGKVAGCDPKKGRL